VSEEFLHVSVRMVFMLRNLLYSTYTPSPGNQFMAHNNLCNAHTHGEGLK